MKILILIIACLINVLVLLQPSKTAGSIIGSENLSLFKNSKERGFEKKLVNITTFLFVLFFVLIVIYRRF